MGGSVAKFVLLLLFREKLNENLIIPDLPLAWGILIKLLFSLFPSFLQKLQIIVQLVEIFCGCLDSNRKSLVLEATTLPTEPQPLPVNYCFNYGSWTQRSELTVSFKNTCSIIMLLQPGEKKQTAAAGNRTGDLSVKSKPITSAAQ